MVGWLKALLFVAGGVTAAAGTAYVTGLLDPLLGRQPQVIASLPQPVQPAPEPAPAVTEETLPLPSDEPLVTEKQDRLVVPTFDVLRVEPDGSVLIAGKSAAGSTVEVLNGDSVLISTKAEAEGDFVAVLDEPLAPGDYRLALRSISGDVVALSLETAIISIPERADGPVLAMVEAPGAPAELLTIPQAPTEMAAAEPEAVEEETAQEEIEAPSEQDIAAVPEAPEATEAPDVTDGETEVADTSAAPEPEADTASETEQDVAETEVAAGPEADTVAGTEDQAPTEIEVTAAPQETEQVEAPQQPVASFIVVVEAVEIEGDTIFVAGQAASGRTVRIYANEIVIGDARVSEAGRFLVEARRELPVGHYMIRADLLDADGSVLARAAVPFEREAGEAIAAVAPPPASQTPQPQAEAPQENASQDGQQAETEVAAADAGSEDATAPALQRVDGSVIIRRGDSLWRISRRVYGRGVRYSTIYLANQDQISDPNRIWPGQIFNVPQETSEGEQADMQAIGDQAVTRDGAPAAQ